jgi:uncharacterized caspase-like protein
MLYPKTRDALEEIRADAQTAQVALNYAHAALLTIANDTVLSPEHARMIDGALEHVAPLCGAEVPA